MEKANIGSKSFLILRAGTINSNSDIRGFASLYEPQEKGAGDMTKRPRRNHTSAFKAKVALEALKGDQKLVELSERFQVHPNQIAEWKKVLPERTSEAFDKGAPLKEPNIKELHAKIGQLAMEIDFLSVALGRIGDPSAKR